MYLTHVKETRESKCQMFKPIGAVAENLSKKNTKTLLYKHCS